MPRLVIAEAPIKPAGIPMVTERASKVSERFLVLQPYIICSVGHTPRKACDLREKTRALSDGFGCHLIVNK
jgi:hypothetical protein